MMKTIRYFFWPRNSTHTQNWETQDVNRKSLEVSGLANKYYDFRDVWVVREGHMEVVEPGSGLQEKQYGCTPQIW